MIIVSACLAGVNCNYNADNKENIEIVEMVRNGTAIMVCPEQLGGLPTPRTPAEIRGGKVFTADGHDVTEEFYKGAREVLRICERFDCKKAILKSRSPSCGCGKIYDGSFTGTLIDGDGVSAALLKEHGIEVVSLG